jgi:hypothetical protein
MPQFQIGDIVISVNSNEKGVITEVCPPARGGQLYKVSIDNSIRNCLIGQGVLVNCISLGLIAFLLRKYGLQINIQ